MKPIGVMVVGSANMDLVFGCPRIPNPGETLLGNRFTSLPGGKGANQAVSIAKLGGQVAFVGKVGTDDNGLQLRRSLESNGVNCSHLKVTDEAPTGVAGIFVAADGQNSIVVAPGANSLITRDEVLEATTVLQPQVTLTQLEIPIEAVSACAGARLLVLNPAPYFPLTDEFLASVDVITPNESETESLTGVTPDGEVNCNLAAEWLLDRGVKVVVLTLGSRGCFVSDGIREVFSPALKVKEIDTTAAGDAFSGALAHFLSQGLSVWEAAPRANLVAALSTTRQGAQDSMPNRAEFEDFGFRASAASSEDASQSH